MEEKLFERKIDIELDEWKKALLYKKKAFLLKGLRQVGKTSSIKRYAYANYENVVYINFKTEISLKEIFAGDLKVDRIILDLSFARPDIAFVPYKTVLIFDEIQECSGARAAIKPFMEDGRFDIIASGSLLGIKGYNKKYQGGVSVGYEHTVYMKPMDFEEFLWAKGISHSSIDYLKTCFAGKKAISPSVHVSMLRYFREYICVGGMPSVLSSYLNEDSYLSAYREQKDILEGYKDDFGKHLNKEEEEETDQILLSRINKVYASLPAQLAKENKKFMYSNIESRGTSAKFDPAIQWLIDYGLANYCHNLRSLSLPLKGNAIENIFKLYIADTGLFMAMLEEGAASDIMFGGMGSYKGYIYENIVADALSKNGIPLYYYSKESGLEIDFITCFQRKLYLVEVKAKNGNAKSSKTVLGDKTHYAEVEGLIKLSESNIRENGNVLSLPYYLAFLLR